MAAANPVVSTVVKRSRETSLELKRVFGEERVEHWEAVKKIVQEKIAPLYGDQASFLKKVETDEDFRCRLLQTDDQPAGVVIYSAKLTDIHGKNDCCLIESFYADDLDASSGPRNMSQCLLDHVLEKAQELKTRALCIKVMKQAGQALKFFQEQHFTILRERETYQWLCRTIEDQTSHSKPETNGSIAHPPVPAAAASTANVDRDPPAPKRPRREEPPAPAAFASPAPSS
ncbi:MAG TPA: hypothetical protein VMR37_06065, partial [Rhabdochlamydiaceae bacterium]|nr:hypothetical protein [Rhabdochlamydiaceae bacterium]